MARRAACLFVALLPTAAHAFSNTYPIVAWSSYSSNTLDSASSSRSADSGVVLERILLNDDVCRNDAIVLIDQLGLHASDLRNLPSSSSLVESLNVAASTLELPYMPQINSPPFSELASAVAERCAARLVSHEAGQTEVVHSGEGKHVVCIGMPSLDGVDGEQRKGMMVEHELQLSSSLASLAKSFPKHLVVYAGWHPAVHTRQLPSPFSSTSSLLNSTAAFAPPSGGILARYQLLTPGLILSLLIGFFVLVPTVMFGVSALAGIKSPLQGEPPKGFIASEKKNQ
ncbi:uncharacterized protein LAESUDRAFT_719503 [Laetiporus sulphureus 93-53]|uniref:Protein BIG1 n=1 Tax=Laetiporus sulphureus 93-53 TaxID=1314785 RepID=A0A165IJU6_9APHY|nr:uncharacterized protein LAESUDRAFT_719503 [Laetiporus sulphureus 93-53]KZT13179.1 hypothetical protein LAESUDRAFT_719503 [Laetiporus sulphureus 93-53]